MIIPIRDKKGWIFTLHFPSYVPFMQYSDRRNLREKMLRAYSSRAFRNNEFDNSQNVLKIVNLRLEMAKRIDLIKPGSEPNLLWITDFPLFEWDDETRRYYAMHHPFTSPRIEDIPLMETNPGEVKARAYDLVYNGNEIAGGSIRIHDSGLQAKMFNAHGIGEKEAREKFGFLTGAFKYGAPPHGGIAFGFDRLAMLFASKTSIRDVIAFPKTSSGLSLMDDSPSHVDEAQLAELHIKIK